MKRTTTLLVSLALAAPMFLGAGAAAAHDRSPNEQDDRAGRWDDGYGRTRRAPPPPAPTPAPAQRWDGHDRTYPAPLPPPPAARPAPPPAPVYHVTPARPQAVRTTGVVQSFLYANRRTVRGVVLTDGSTVLLRRADATMRRWLRPGMTVRVSGFALPNQPGVIRQATVSAIRQLPRRPGIVVAPAPAPLPQPAPLPAPAPAFAPTISGTIRSFLTGPNHLIDHIVLTNGAVIAIPADLARAVTRHGLQTGEHVQVGVHRSGQRLTATSLRAGNGPTFYASNW